MTEKEKAEAGCLYDANYDENLLADRAVARELCFQYNHLPPSQEDGRQEIIKKLFRKTGAQFWLEPPFHCDYGYHIEIGENFYANVNCVILDGAEVIFGDNVFIAPNCGFYTAGHPFDVSQRNQGLEYAWPIRVGNDVWIGGNVAVLPGVSIGNGSVIGAGSVVTKDIPAGVLAAGNPCRVIREITEADRERYSGRR